MKKRILSVLLTLCMVIGLISTAVFAEGEAKKSITLGTVALEGAQKSNVWFGNYKQSGNGSGGFNVDPVRWRVLRNSEGQVWLLSDKILDTYYYHNVDGWFQDVYYQDCLMKKWLNSELEEGGFSDAAFSPKEYDAVVLKEERLGKVMLLSLGETTYSEWYSNGRTTLLGVDSDYVAAGGTTGPRTFGGNGEWVLRNDWASESVYTIESDGDSDYSYYGENTVYAARPSIYLDSSKVLFTSPAVGGKTESGLTAVWEYNGNDYKLTVSDSDRNGFLATLKSYSGNTVRFDYEGAKTGANEYISAMV